MTKERLDQIRTSMLHNPRNAEYHVNEMLGAYPKLIAERDAARAEVEMLRGVGCGEVPDGPCGVCLKCARRERDEARSSLRDIAEGDCEYGDNCLPNAGTRHGTCTPCRARQALGKVAP